MGYDRKKFLEFMKNRAIKRAAKLAERAGKVAGKVASNWFEISKVAALQPEKETILTGRIVTAATAQSILTLLNGFPHALMGGFALASHGYNRATTDIDVMVRSQDIPAIVQRLGLTNVRPLEGITGVAGNTADGTEVDLVASDFSFGEDALASAQNGPGGKVLSKQYLVLCKMLAQRGAKDDHDAMQMIRMMNPAEQKQTRKLVRQHLPNDVEDYDQFVEFAPYAA